MKSEVPGCEPREFPLVRHRHDVGGDEVTPMTVASTLATLGRRRLSRIAIEPTQHIEVIKLLVPQHPCQGLTLYPAYVLVGNASLQRGVKGIGLGKALSENIIEVGEVPQRLLACAEPYADRGAAAGRDRTQIKTGDFGALSRWVHGFGSVVDDVFVEGVLEVSLHVRTEESRRIGFVFAEEQAIGLLEGKPKLPELCMARLNDAVALIAQRWFRRTCRPAPGVAEPGLRQNVDGRPLGTAVMNRHPH